jgi:hypothetical protein
MEHVELTSQEIEILFENCECILIDMWAIKFLRFETDYDTYTWDKSHKNFMKQTRLKYFKLVVDLDDTRYFYHTNRLIDTKTVEEDGIQCINRLIHSDDITDLYINGTCFNIPWVNEKYIGHIAGTPIDLYRNKAQINSELTDTSGGHTLTIEVDVRDKEKVMKIRGGQAARDITEAESEADE